MSQVPQNDTPRRWYDEVPKLSGSVMALEKFPSTWSSIIAEGILQLAESRYGQLQSYGDLKSLGKDKIMPLYKAKQKKRKYDKSPSLHRVMNAIFLMSPDHQEEMGQELGGLVECVVMFVAQSKALNYNVSLDDVTLLTQTYIWHGPEATHTKIQLLSQELTAKHQANSAKAKKQAIISGHQSTDMKLTEKSL